MQLQRLYELQVEFQEKVLEKLHKENGRPMIALPQDDVYWSGYHVQAMVEELGEVMKADKRWKTHRNEQFDIDNKIDEIVDVFITAMNMAIFSGISGDQLVSEILAKIQENTCKLATKNNVH